MNQGNDHERIDNLLGSHGRTWAGKAAEHEEAAEKARGEKHRVMGMQHNIPAEAKGRLEGVHDHAIRHHEKQARVHRRRAEHAAAGYLLDGPDERRDSEYQRSHAELIGMAGRTGRTRFSDESLDD